MGITECANGHIYDTDYYDVCPYCNRNSERSKGTGLLCPFCMAKNEAEAEICKVCGRPIKTSNGVHELPVGTLLFNRYYVGKTMRQGGFGITYVGCDIKLDKKIAIKEYFPQGMVNRLSSHSCEVVSVDNSKDIFERERVKSINEARILAEFAGEPNIVSVTDVLSENGTVYIVMEYVEGTDLDEYLRSNPKMSFQEAFLMIYPVICALQKVHEKGLIHRDISPSNIKITLNGIPVLLDFGAAREYSTEVEKSLSVILKPGYAPPEQFSSHGKQGPFTDVYAISATIYYMITGIDRKSVV